jgi:hypothetical protein
MTTQEEHPTHARVDDAIQRDIGNIRQELIGFKRLVLIQLVDIKERLTTLTDALLPLTPRETTLMSTGDTVMEPMTGEDNLSVLGPAGASLIEASVPAGQQTQDQSMLPDTQGGGCVIVR